MALFVAMSNLCLRRARYECLDFEAVSAAAVRLPGSSGAPRARRGGEAPGEAAAGPGVGGCGPASLAPTRVPDINFRGSAPPDPGGPAARPRARSSWDKRGSAGAAAAPSPPAAPPPAHRDPCGGGRAAFPGQGTEGDAEPLPAQRVLPGHPRAAAAGPGEGGAGGRPHHVTRAAPPSPRRAARAPRPRDPASHRPPLARAPHHVTRPPPAGSPVTWPPPPSRAHPPPPRVPPPPGPGARSPLAPPSRDMPRLGFSLPSARGRQKVPRSLPLPKKIPGVSTVLQISDVPAGGPRPMAAAAVEPWRSGPGSR
ncbi:basic proline-rich protein-like [Melospiza melodia melodia]|uniref:basic proline-rich protein-like n=1 Tax=Melospiza melodia melodia TaxID=1914991 RepID=UPI002FD1F3AB